MKHRVSNYAPCKDSLGDRAPKVTFCEQLFRTIPALVVAILLVASALSLAAQSVTGTITGTVTDATGAVVTGAKVTAQETATGVTHNAATNAQGIFSFQNFSRAHIV